MSQNLIASAAIILAGSSVAGQAQDVCVTTGNEYYVSMPMPSFHNGIDWTESRQLGIGASGRTFALDALIPAGESFETWTKLFAIKIEEGVDITFEQYVGQLKNSYFAACHGLVDDMIMPVEQRQYLAIHVIPCVSYINDPTQGEVGIYFVVNFRDIFVQIYRQWRGNTFELTDPTRWPASLLEIESFLTNIRGYKFIKK